MISGKVKWFNKTKGFGFIIPEDGGEDVFVHVTVLEKSGVRFLEEGHPVSFETEIKNGRLRAVAVEVDANTIPKDAHDDMISDDHLDEETEETQAA